LSTPTRFAFLRDHPAISTALILALAALVVRVAALALQGPAVMDGDAANFSRIAQNIHDGIGNVTIRDVPNILHAPLFPILTAAVMFVVHSPERAGIIVSMISGIALVVFIYRLTTAIADFTTGAVAGALAVFHPLLVTASIVPLSESLFMALSFAGLDTLVRALQRPSYRNFAVAGFFFGCDYDTREETIAFTAIGIVAVLVASLYARRDSLRVAAVRTAALLIPFAICAVPYVAYLSRTTGHFAIEAKSLTNYDLSRNVARGVPYLRVAYAIGPNLQDVGVEAGPSYPFSQTRISPPSPYSRLLLALQTAPHQLLDVVRALASKRNGMLPFFLFALIGAASRPWLRTGYDFIIAAMLLTEFAALLSVNWFWDRYADPFAALVVPWTACGIVQVVRWMRRTLSLPLVRAFRAFLVFLVGPVWFTTTAIELRRDAVDPTLFRDAGAWIAIHGPAHAIVMASNPVTAYYARGVARGLPYTDSSTAIRYIVSRAPCFVVVSNLFTDRPYLAAWAQNGIPHASDERVFSEQKNGDRIAVYRFSSNAEAQHG
jgi:hypothetical protein